MVMSVLDIQQQVQEDSEEWFPETSKDLGFITLAMGGEVGEAQNIVKKILRDSNGQITPEVRLKLSLELADAFIYICQAMNFLGLNLEHTYQYKRGVNVERFGK